MCGGECSGGRYLGFAHTLKERGDAFANWGIAWVPTQPGHVIDELADERFTCYFTRAKVVGGGEMAVSGNPLGCLRVGFHTAAVLGSWKSRLPSSRPLILRDGFLIVLVGVGRQAHGQWFGRRQHHPSQLAQWLERRFPA